MEIRGKIISISDKISGTSKKTGEPWSRQDYVIETIEQYPKRCCFSVLSEKRINAFDIKLDEMLNVHFAIDARFYDGRWYNEIVAWRVDRV